MGPGSPQLVDAYLDGKSYRGSYNLGLVEFLFSCLPSVHEVEKCLHKHTQDCHSFSADCHGPEVPATTEVC